MESLVNSIVKSATITQEDFIDALNSYLEDNYSDQNLKTISDFDSKIGFEKKNKVYTLYRGVFFNEISEKEKQRLMGLKEYSDNNISFSTEINVAKAFAMGSNIYDKSEQLKDNQVGLLLERTFRPDEIVIDIDYASSKDDYESLQAISESEVLVKQKKRILKVKQIFTSENTSK